MTLRVHFGTDDLARLTFAPGPDPLWELLLSLHQAQTEDGSPVFGSWRRRVRAGLGDQTRRLLELAPPQGYSPDFLTPWAAGEGLRAGLAAVARTDSGRIRPNLDELARVPRWAGGLLRPDGPARLARLMGSYFRTAIAPHWAEIRRQVDRDLAVRARTVLTEGLHGAGEQAPGLTWESSVLHVDNGQAAVRDLHLDGRGLRLVPSYFCWRHPITLRDPSQPPVLVYPVQHQPLTEAPTRTGPTGPQALGSLLGRTRAGVLRAIAHGCCSTTELAARAGVSPATASEHARILKEAGLISTHRSGIAVTHTLQPSGRTLLSAPSA
ncbi:helix-turn-helix domain-containing protein [Kribbella sp. DT2]|uniref:ArsR/SmtB family transcription factor n=1 Tax=Kribbella sp. DT2 TaxID=3393427 RepID=UPI003CEA3FE3